MQREKIPPQFKITEESFGNIINEETQKLKLSQFMPKSYIINNKNNYYIIKTLVIISSLITLFFANISKIKLYLKEREVLKTLNNESS